MATRISEKHDTMVLQLVSGRGLSAAGKDTLLVGVKAWLDANVASFKDSTGNYTVPHVRQALTTVLAKGK